MTAIAPASGPGASLPGSRLSPWWLIAGGAVVCAIALVLLAHPAFTSASVTVFAGACLVFAGIGMVVAAIASRHSGSMLGGIVLGSIVTIAGALLWSDLLAGTATLTAVAIAWLLVDGVVGAVMALAARPPGWGAMLVGSLLGLLLGVLLWAGWPTTAEWALGVYAGLLLLMRGLQLVVAGLVLRQLEQR